jgi:hypothetical protein
LRGAHRSATAAYSRLKPLLLFSTAKFHFYYPQAVHSLEFVRVSGCGAEHHFLFAADVRAAAQDNTGE